MIKTLLSPINARIRSGPLKGAKWSLPTGLNFIRGVYEPEKTNCIVATVRAGMRVLDVGAHMGYFSMIMSNLAGREGKVHAYEPRPSNLKFLRQHLSINDISNVTVYPKCLGNTEGPAMFETRTGSGTGHVSGLGNVRVEMTTIDRLNSSFDYIKIDVEGHEVEVIEGGYQTIRKNLPVILLAVHSISLEKKCRELLDPLGYRFTDIGQSKGDREFLVEREKG